MEKFGLWSRWISLPWAFLIVALVAGPLDHRITRFLQIHLPIFRDQLASCTGDSLESFLICWFCGVWAPASKGRVALGVALFSAALAVIVQLFRLVPPEPLNIWGDVGFILGALGAYVVLTVAEREQRFWFLAD